MRLAQLLIEGAKNYPAACKRAVVRRPLLAFAMTGSANELQRSWSPLRKELEKLRHARSPIRTQ